MIRFFALIQDLTNALREIAGEIRALRETIEQSAATVPELEPDALNEPGEPNEPRRARLATGP